MKKTEAQIFKENLFSKQIQKDLAIAMEKKLHSGMKKMMNQQIDNNVWMKRLIEFYEEEMGSDSDMSGHDDDTSVDSLSSASEDAPVEKARQAELKK